MRRVAPVVPARATWYLAADPALPAMQVWKYALAHSDSNVASAQMSLPAAGL